VNEDYPVEEYEEELLKYYEAKKELNRVFYEDWIGASIFQVDVKKLKDKFNSKIDEINEVLFKCVKKKLQ